MSLHWLDDEVENFSVAFLARYLTRESMPREAAFSVPESPVPLATGDKP